MTPKQKDIREFMKLVDGSTEETAVYYIEMCGGDVREAINLYFELHSHGQGDTPTNVANPGIQGTKKESSRVASDNAEQNEDFVRAPDKHFSQALIHDMDEANFVYTSKKANKKEVVDLTTDDSLGKLFSPPREIICELSFDQMRKKAKMEDRYVLVNIQNSDFDSMRLNRDIWKNEAIQQIIKDFFIFWMRHETDQDAAVFMHTYKVTKLPYICALCKRTGRQLKVWNTKQFGDVICAQSQLYEFIETAERNYSTESVKKSIDTGTNKSHSSISASASASVSASPSGSANASATRAHIGESRNIGGASDKKRDSKQSLKAVVKTVQKGDSKNLQSKKDVRSLLKKDSRKGDISSTKKETVTNETKRRPSRSTPPVPKAAATKPETTTKPETETVTTTDTTSPEVKFKDFPLKENTEYNRINNELLELHKLRLERMKKK